MLGTPDVLLAVVVRCKQVFALVFKTSDVQMIGAWGSLPPTTATLPSMNDCEVQRGNIGENLRIYRKVLQAVVSKGTGRSSNPSISPCVWAEMTA